MRKMILLAALALAAGVLLPGSALPAVGGSDLPLKGTQSGYGTGDLRSLPVVHAHIVTTGEVSHSGLATAVQDLVIVFTGPATFTFTGTWTVRAANGDQTYGTLAGSGVLTDAVHSTSEATYTSSGGTGRFADASSTFTAITHATRVSFEGGIATNYYEATIEGRSSNH